MEKILESQRYEKFFSWLLNKNVTNLYSEIDKSTGKTIYFPPEFKEILDSKSMQRLKNIMQLSTMIIENQNVYNTRYSHSIGTYNNGVILFLNQFENEDWRKKSESEESKLEIIASLIELLTHDLGHLTFSHTLEKLVGKPGTHEILTNRIIDERLQEEISRINPKLPDILKKRRQHGDIATIKEGNIDFDRLDYLLHDTIYIGDKYKNIEEVSNEILNHISMENIDGRAVPVFDNEVIGKLKYFLAFRIKKYKEFYYSDSRNTLDNNCYCFCRFIANQENPIIPEFTEYLNLCISEGENLDLDKHESWSDIDSINAFLEIAEKSDSDALTNVALLNIPTLSGLINLVYEFVDFPEEADKEGANLQKLIPEENKRNLYEKVKKYVKGVNLTEKETKIRKLLFEKETLNNKIKTYEISGNSETFFEEIENTRNFLREKNLPEELVNNLVWKKVLMPYSTQDKNFARTETGEIVELNKHPNFKIKNMPIYIGGVFFYEDLLRIYDVPEHAIRQIEEKLDTYQKGKPITTKKTKAPSQMAEMEDAIYGRY